MDVLACALHFSLSVGRHSADPEGSKLAEHQEDCGSPEAALLHCFRFQQLQITTTTLLHKSSKRPNPCPTTGVFFGLRETKDALSPLMNATAPRRWIARKGPWRGFQNAWTHFEKRPWTACSVPRQGPLRASRRPRCAQSFMRGRTAINAARSPALRIAAIQAGHAAVHHHHGGGAALGA